MKRALTWIWDRGIVSTFLAGLLVVLPLAITIWIMGWVAGMLREVVGPEPYIGEGLRSLGLRFVANDTVATIVGWVLVIVAVWLLGLFVKSTTRFRVIEKFNWAMSHVPVVRTVYGPVAQVVGMLRRQDREELNAMSVVYCKFGEQAGGGFLALLASAGLFRFGEQDCHLVYIPTSPLPMTGGLIFVPARAVDRVDMTIEALMQMYFSMGVMATKAVPGNFQVSVTLPPQEATPGAG
ncbi:MAG: DUF502 domain-containing protein [Planctomycetes bacterium]|nr:DUF502 domain-containing protein [Planctomycetota bacterium]